MCPVFAVKCVLVCFLLVFCISVIHKYVTKSDNTSKHAYTLTLHGSLIEFTKLTQHATSKAINMLIALSGADFTLAWLMQSRDE